MELKMLSENLQQKNLEVRRLNKEMKQCKDTVVYLRNELALCQYHNLKITKQDAETMAGVCCTEPECGDYEPVKECVPPVERAQMQEKVQKMQVEIKSSSESVLRLRRMNAALSKEVIVLHRLCGALHDQCRSVCISSQFKDDIIREMRRQLKQAKAKIKECDANNYKYKNMFDDDLTEQGFGTVAVACVRQPHARSEQRPEFPDTDSDNRSSRFGGQADDVLSVKTN